MTKCTLFDQVFAKLQCSFRKGFSAEQCLIHIIKKWRKFLDTGGHVGVPVTNLSKAFDCVNHQLLIAKVNPYGVDTNSLYILAYYFEKRKQKTKVGGSCSNFDDNLCGVLLVSILGRHYYLTYPSVIYFLELEI